MLDIAISIVLFQTDETELGDVIDLLNQSSLNKIIYLIDNSEDDRLRIFADEKNVDYFHVGSNLGYGRGHNIAIQRAKNIAKYHLVINSDVDFNPGILKKAFDFMEDNAEVGMLSPQIQLFSGEMQHFCRKLPTPFDLFARRFIPGFLKPMFKKSLDEYVMLDADYSKPMNVPNLPGCFMFIRMSNLLEVGGFDENIFMYCEDIDLTRRLHQISITLYYPGIVIKHGLARGSYTFSKLVVYHINSAIYYFRKWGWFFDKDRRRINKSIKDFDMRNLHYGVHEIASTFKSAV